MPVIHPNPRTKFLFGATLSLAATLLLARVTSESWTLTVAGGFLTAILGLPIVIMIAGLASIFLLGALYSPLGLLVICIVGAAIFQIPISWMPPILIASAVVYLVALFVLGPKFFDRPVPLRIYEFGADRIVPYYTWLWSPRRAGITGALIGILIGFATIWVARLWHSVDSLSART